MGLHPLVHQSDLMLHQDHTVPVPGCLDFFQLSLQLFPCLRHHTDRIQFQSQIKQTELIMGFQLFFFFRQLFIHFIGKLPT